MREGRRVQLRDDAKACLQAESKTVHQRRTMPSIWAEKTGAILRALTSAQTLPAAASPTSARNRLQHLAETSRRFFVAPFARTARRQPL